MTHARVTRYAARVATPRIRLTLVAALATTLLLNVEPPRAQAVSDDDTVAVTVGKETLTVRQVETRIRAVPPFQLKRFGSNVDEIRRAFVQKVLVPELLFAQEAEARKLGERETLAPKLRDIHRAALQESLQAAADKTPISDAEIRAYYEKHKSKYETPMRIQIWRILVNSKAEAAKVIESFDGASIDGWKKLTREKSVDAATKMRSGNLGFVQPDGKTSVPRVQVDKALYAAAAEVEDGELVPNPVPEGKRFAVVWRRGSMDAVQRGVAAERDNIRQILERQRSFAGTEKLLEKLNNQHVKDVKWELLEFVDVSKIGRVTTRSREGVLPRRKPGNPAPRRGDRGLR